MSGKLKSPVIHMSLSAFMHDGDVSRFCRYSVLTEGGLEKAARGSDVVRLGAGPR